MVGKEINHKNYGEVIYDKFGLPICHICGKSFKKLLSHVWQKHDLSAHDYKIIYGLDTSKSIMCEESVRKARVRCFEHYDVVVKKNLIEKGENTRYKEGDKGRTKDKVSKQTERRLAERGKIMLMARWHKGDEE